jgi:hypothetical protein
LPSLLEWAHFSLPTVYASPTLAEWILQANPDRGLRFLNGMAEPSIGLIASAFSPTKGGGGDEAKNPKK